MQEFKYDVDYKGGSFVKTVYADTPEQADDAIQARYADSPDFTVLAPSAKQQVAASNQLHAMFANARNAQTVGSHNGIADAARQFTRDQDELGDGPAAAFLVGTLGLA